MERYWPVETGKQGVVAHGERDAIFRFFRLDGERMVFSTSFAGLSALFFFTLR
jgi:hypothetical protein